mgnify:CR=1 FL=1
MNKKIVIKGAKEHNLRNISVEIPKDKFVVITGLSGSGKSSLAFDTIYAEGQRRYVESLSAYARQFLDKMKKPKVDFIEGLSPAISIEQKNTSKNPRSTVATVTEIYDYMRVLYARIGTPYSPFTGKEIKSQTVSQIVDKILELPKKSTIFLFAPIVRGRKGEYKKEILSYKKRGFRKVKVDGTLYDIDKTPDLNKKLKHDIYILVDRIVINSDLGNRLAEGIETSLNLANGLLFVEYQNETLPAKFRKTEKLTFSSKFACPESGFTIEEIEPRLFSFNSPYGACEECEGIGIKLNVDPNLVVPDDKKSIAQGAIQPWAKTTTLYYAQTLTSLAKHYKFSMDEKWSKLPKKIKDIILFGSDDEEIKFSYDDGYEKYSHKKTFEGVINNLERRYLETDSDWKREEIAQYQSDTKCERCNGYRLKDEALCVKINELNISQVTEKSIFDAKEWFRSLEVKLDKRQIKIAQQNIVNFYANENVNPYVAISAMGPWIVTLKGAVIYDCGGYGMLGLGHSPKLALNEIKKPHVMANVMTPSLSQMEFIDILKKEIGHSRTNKSTFTEFCCLNSGSESVSIGARLADVNAKELTAKGAKHFGKTIARLTLSGSFHGRTDRPAQFSDSTRSSYKKHLKSFENKNDLFTVTPNDIDELKEVFKKAEKENIFIEAFFMEPVMGEGNPGQAISPEFYDEARKLTKESVSYTHLTLPTKA